MHNQAIHTTTQYTQRHNTHNHTIYTTTQYTQWHNTHSQTINTTMQYTQPHNIHNDTIHTARQYTQPTTHTTNNTQPASSHRLLVTDVVGRFYFRVSEGDSRPNYELMCLSWYWQQRDIWWLVRRGWSMTLVCPCDQRQVMNDRRWKFDVIEFMSSFRERVCYYERMPWGWSTQVGRWCLHLVGLVESYTYLDVVPVPFRTSGDDLLPSGTIIRSWFDIVPFAVHFCQIFFKCLALGLSWPFCLFTASFRHPLHHNMCHLFSR